MTEVREVQKTTKHYRTLHEETGLEVIVKMWTIYHDLTTVDGAVSSIPQITGAETLAGQVCSVISADGGEPTAFQCVTFQGDYQRLRVVGTFGFDS